MEFIQILGVLLAFGALLFLVVVTTRYVGSKAGKAMKGKYIDVVEAVSIGIDKQLLVVRAGEQYILVASAGKNIEFLTTINLDEFHADETAQNGTVFDFKKLFEKYIQAFKNRGNLKVKEVEEDLELSGEREVFKTNLRRLKEINNKMSKQLNDNGDERTNEK